MKKVYAGIVLAGMMAAMLLATGCPNPTSDDPVYSIGLEPTGSVVFTGATVGYSAQTARTVTVTNTGNQDTGELAIVKSGTNAARFTVSKNSLANIAAGGTDTFTVVPNRSLAAGTYTATITVSGEHDISASFSVSFTVGPRAEYGIALSKTGTHNFPPAIVGYGAQTAETVTITNTGNQSTGSLTIAKTGAGAAGFTVSKTSVADLVANGTDTFTVVPATGLAVGTYTATITISGGNDLSASLNVSFKVNPTTPVYSVDLSETEPYEFPGAEAGYEEAPEEKEVTVTNTGNRATGALTITSSPANFTVTPASLAGIEEGATGSFTVAPKTGLRAGTYDSTITVSGSGGISAGFAVSFTVTPAYRVSLSETGTYPFPGAAVGYGAQAARTVTIRNTGDAATGALTIASGNTNFVVSKTGITDLALNGTDTFTVVPKDGLAASSTPYTATITVGGGNIPSAGFDVSFTVAAASYGISLSAATFPEVYPGYEAAPVRSITVINEGNQATGALTIAKGGTNAASFTVSETTIAAPGIPGGESGSITVTPIDGLTAGTYTATVTVSGGANITSKNVAVSFTVKTPGNPFYEIGLGVTGTYTFPAAIEGYTTAPTRDVTITNEGNQATGALNIASGSGSSNFTVSPATITDVGISVSDSFTVAPNTMLSAGTYTETITVSGANITSKDFVVSFTVEPPTYIVGLSETGPYVFPDAFYGYTVGTALTRTVTITSTGNQATGALNIASDSANFEVSKTSIVAPGIGPNGAKESFTVTPAADLSIGGPYTATITVSGGDIASKSFDVSFTVTTAPVISLSDTGYVFPTATVGYGAQTPRTVTVTNAGDKETGRLMITKSGTNSGDFAVSKNSLNSIAVGETDSFTVVPNTRLSAKDTPYTATVTVGGEGIVPRTFDMSFTVNPYAVTFSAPGSVPATSTALARGANNTVALPQNPSRNGYTFDGWYTTGGSPFTATTRVTRDITVYARWKSANARLADLSVSQGVLLPAFNANTTAYSVEVPYATTSINVNATRADGKPYVQYPSGNPVSLNVGLNVITLKVIADDGTVIDYTIGVTRAQALSNNANLSSLGVSVGALSPVFSPDRTAYTVVVPKDTFNITINAAAADVKAESVVQSPGVLAALTALGSKPSIAIAITVTAEDGSVKAYTITVTKGEANNAVNVSIGITDEYIDLTGNNQNDLSRELNNSLRLKAPDGYTNYVWRVDGVVQASFNNLSTFELLDAGVLSLGTHSVLLEYKKDGTTYGCEVQFRVVR